MNDMLPVVPGDPKVGDDAPHGLIPAKILIADDEPRNLLAVSEILAGPGLELVVVDSGEEVLRQILRHDFAAILLDVRMPRLDGFEVATMVRARARSSRVPIVFMTAYSKDDLHIFRGYSAGAVDYVFKPIEPLILKSKVAVFVDLYRKTEEIKRQHAAEKELLLENLRVRNERLDAERALRRGEEHQALVLRGLPIGLYTSPLGGAGRPLHFTSDNVERLSGCSRSAFEDPFFWEKNLHPEDRDRVLAELDAANQTNDATIEYRWRCAAGDDRHILDRVVMIRDPDGTPRETFGMWFDISERKELERRLQHASKLEAVGRLTGGIAHDFNNMLNVVIGNLDLLKRTLKDDEKAQRRVENAIEGAQRCADLTSRLLAFSRRSPLQTTILHLNEVMPSIVELLQRTLGERINVLLELPANLPSIRVDRSQFEAALVNLALNARDAMPDGGALRIRVHPSEREPAPGAEWGFVEISIEDTGTGMPPDVVDRVFEPFFTTKEAGKGTGLGLSMVYGFAQQSGGDIVIDSRFGEGTKIRLSFPALPAEHDGAPENLADGTDVLDADGQTILVVEDEEAVRHVTTSTLEALGFLVVQAVDAEEALAALEREPAIRLVFSDVRIPGGLSGIQLSHLIRDKHPDVALLLTSGFMEEEHDLNGFEFLQKPYRTAELVAKLSTVFGLCANR
jgi:PAS domain S-box-containing protein